jgi:purine-nucleoside phosphorylase
MAGDFAALQSAAQANRPVAAFVLGSGMGAVTDRILTHISVGFADIPGMVAPTVAGHKGHLIYGDLADKPILAFTGRLHFYEGHPWERVVRTVEVAAELGAKTLVLTNASGGIADVLGPGSLMALTDHLELNRKNCWNQPGPGTQPSPYCPAVRDALDRAAQEANVPLERGVYAAVTGPTYESPAEIRAIRTWGGDAVGMSTTREALRGVELGMNVGAISCIANRAAGLTGQPLSHKEVLEVVTAASARLADLLTAYVSSMN